MAMTMDLFENAQPFTIAQAVEAGISKRVLLGPAYRRLRSGVYVSAEVPDSVVLRTRAALLVAPEKGVVSHSTAGRLWGATHLTDPRIHLAYTRDVRGTLDGIKCHRFREPFSVCHRRGLLVTTPDQTFVHCALGLGLLDQVALGDRLVKHGPDAVTSVASLKGFSEMWSGQGGHNARRAADLVRAGVDSVPETHLRLLIVLGGLPEPELDVRLFHDDGTLRRRFELAFRTEQLAIEYDGRWHDAPEQQSLDLARREELGAEGWRFELVRAEDLYDDPEWTLHRLWGAMRDRGIHVPAVLSSRWQRHFSKHLLTG